MTFIHSGSRIDFHSVKLCQTTTMTEVFLEYAPHRYHTHIRSLNYSHRMCICQETRIRKALKLTFIHSDSTFDNCYVLNLCQTASMTEVFWTLLYTGTPHLFALPTTVIACVFVKQKAPTKISNCRLYRRTRDLTVLMISTCAKLLQ